jgi:hypothetical protein
MDRPEHINIVEVGPRDGLQNEAQPLLPSERIELIGHPPASRVARALLAQRKQLSAVSS